jgi:UPF0755 protein
VKLNWEPGTYVGRAERRARKRRRARGIALMLVLVLVVGAATFELYRLTARPSRPQVAAGQKVTFTIAPGEGTMQIADALAKAGVVSSAGSFRAAADRRGVSGALKPGSYQLLTGMNLDDLLDVLVRGPAAGPRFTIPEGATVQQIIARIAATKLFTGAQIQHALASHDLDVPYRPKGVTSMEGLLFPLTYDINKADTAVDVLQRMLDQLQAVLANYDLTAAPMHLTPYQVLIVASMIEREAKVPQDRPKIARVIYNRLARHLPLQVDATLAYALHSGSRHLTDKDLTLNSPYNSYTHGSLPPTPIASPGEASIRAALQPAAGPWLFYVLIKPDGEHAFTASATEFAKLKAQAHKQGLL